MPRRMTLDGGGSTRLSVTPHPCEPAGQACKVVKSGNGSLTDNYELRDEKYKLHEQSPSF